MMLTHSYINLLISLIYQLKPFISYNFIHTIHGRFWSNSSQPGLFLTVPKTEQWAVLGQPTQHTSVPLCGTEFHGRSRPHTHQNTIYCINHDPRYPKNPHTVMDCPNGFQKFSHFGPKFWDRSNGHSRPQSTQAFIKHLNKG